MIIQLSQTPEASGLGEQNQELYPNCLKMKKGGKYDKL